MLSQKSDARSTAVHPTATPTFAVHGRDDDERNGTHLRGLTSGLGSKLLTRGLSYRNTGWVLVRWHNVAASRPARVDGTAGAADNDDEPPVDLRAVCYEEGRKTSAMLT
jgi:hypothetical protein